MNNIYKYDFALRKNNDLIIIWSDQFKSYYYPTTNRGKEFLENCYIQKKISLSEIHDQSLLRDLNSLGFSNEKTIRTLDLSKFHHVPMDVYFDFTHECNLKCAYCYSNKNKKDSILSPEMISGIIFQLWQLGIYRLHLAGGEPTLYSKNLFSYIKSAYKYSICTSITTNGLFQDEKIIENLIKYNIYSITFSIHAFSNEQLKSVSDNILKIKKLKQRSKSIPLVNIKYVWNGYTEMRDIERVIKFGNNLQVDCIKLNCTEKSPTLYEDENYFNKLCKKEIDIRKIVEKYDVEIKLHNPFFNKEIIGMPGNMGCIGGQELLAILPDSTITPCVMNTNPSFGNLINDYEGNLIKFLSSDILKKYQTYICSNINDECLKCENFQFCRGGSTTRQIYKGQFECPYRHIIKISSNNLDEINTMTNFSKLNILHSL